VNELILSEKEREKATHKKREREQGAGDTLPPSKKKSKKLIS